ncbi:helix-turn-helix domain-containing protein [Micromonospora sp. URMC 107]|uniref:helix-turn-helix domain-containing protein n=1 Tax=Micromonospora sp. URMC 107 TaxID=3423418 RepID=UPI003F1A7C4F
MHDDEVAREPCLQQIRADLLRVETAAILGRDARSAELAERTEGISRIRAALSTYGMAFGQPVAWRDASPDQLSRAVGHAWTTYQHARYPQLIEQLPMLLTDVQRLQAQDPNADRTAVVEAYRVTAALLVKLDEASLAWLAADRAMSAATGDRVLLACAAVQLGQVLRASARAKSVLLAAAYRIAPADLGDGHDHHHTAFGPTAVDLARVAAAVELDDGTDAVVQHERTIERDGWRWLPLEHRAAHLVDAARAYLQIGDVTEAARSLMRADNIVPSEIRHRPAARNVVVEVAQHPDAPTTITDFATSLGLA